MELQKCNSDKSHGNLFFQEYFKKSKVKDICFIMIGLRKVSKL